MIYQSMKINPLVVDLSHYDSAANFVAAKAAGLIGVIYKATQGTGYQDPTYVTQRTLALKAGIKWGAYHFGDSSDVKLQVANFLAFAQIDPDTLFCLDFEPYDPNTMTLSKAQDFITQVEDGLGRPGECVIYSGNLIKEDLGSKIDPFFGSRRLWLAQYGSTPVVQASWKTYWIWQYTGDGQGPGPHTLHGLPNPVDLSSYDGTPEDLAAQWASGTPVPVPPPPPPSDLVVTITINAPPGVTVKVNQERSA
jgi:GH25 family lysozyme M1 (1,4-beta-N-acetylmuramidase)